MSCSHFFLFFFFNDTASTEIYTLSLHDALPILVRGFKLGIIFGKRFRQRFSVQQQHWLIRDRLGCLGIFWLCRGFLRSEEHTSELQSRPHLVCRLLLEKKNTY